MNSEFSQKKHAMYAWTIFFICVCFVFYKYILEVSPSVLTQTLMAEYHIKAATVGSIAGAYYYAYLVMQIPGGILVDTFGPRKVAAIAIITCALGSFLFAISENVLMLVISRIVMGTGATFAVLNTLKLVSNWFEESQFSFLLGLMLTFGTLGAVFGQGPLSYLIHLVGWKMSFISFAVAGVVFAIVFYLIVRDIPKHKKNDTVQVEKKKKWVLNACLHALRKKETWILSMYSGLAFAPVVSFAGLWGVSFIETKYDLAKTQAAFLTSIIFIGFAVGAPTLGDLSSYMRRRKPIMFWGTFLALCFLAIVIYLPTMSYIFYAIMLFCLGFSISSFLLSFSIIHEINLPLMTATAVGIMNTFNAVFNAITDPLIGFFLDIGEVPVVKDGAYFFSLENYYMALLLLVIYLIISFILLFFIEETYCVQITEDKEVRKD